ncbi:MAG: 50S ribosomal protein L5 [Parachlamydiales bacterium]
MARLKERYLKEVRPKLQEEFRYANPMLIPRLRKVVVNMGISEAAKDKGVLQDHLKELAAITGQKPVVTQTRKAVANFKTRKGQPIGAKATLRGERMWDFVGNFIDIVGPRISDFRGFEKTADHQGNYTLGLKSQEIFPAVNLDELKRSQGLSITFVTTATSDEEVYALLGGFGMPFKKK